MTTNTTESVADSQTQKATQNQNKSRVSQDDSTNDSSYKSPSDADQSHLHQMIRVDHAGEYGAVRIYQGQMDALKGRSQNLDLIRHMQEQEEHHLATFNDLIAKHKVRPTLLNPLWHVAGYAMGYITGRMGEKAAMACTVAVENCIDKHYEKQQESLEKRQNHPELLKIVKQFRAEELEHRDTALEHGAEQTPGFDVINTVITKASKLAIFLSKRL